MPFIPDDITIAKQFGLAGSMEYAGSIPKAFGFKGQNKGEADRMRHMALSADLHQNLPAPLASALTTAHEVSGVIRDFDYRLNQEDKQDLMHNAMGARIAGVTDDRYEAAQMAANVVRGERIHSFPQLKGKMDYGMLSKLGSILLQNDPSFDVNQHQSKQLSEGPFKETFDRHKAWEEAVAIDEEETSASDDLMTTMRQRLMQ